MIYFLHRRLTAFFDDEGALKYSFLFDCADLHSKVDFVGAVRLYGYVEVFVEEELLVTLCLRLW